MAAGNGSAATVADSTAQAFEEQRPLLFGIAYRMLGSGTEAEDVVQDAYLRFRAATSGAESAEAIRSPRAYLATIVTRLCLDQLKSARARREQFYIGPWLPEPLPTGADDPELVPGRRIEEQETLSMAFLVLLESLAPLERAAFVLHHVFDYSFREVAELTGRREDACRQAYHRARAALAQRRPRYHATAEAAERLTAAFVQAAGSGNVEQLTSLLANDVVCWSDGGGKASAATRPLYGPEPIVRFTLGIARKVLPALSVTIEPANGRPAIVLREPDGTPFMLMLVDGDEHGAHAIYVLRNPDKLARFARPPDGASSLPSINLPAP
ncbi:MAG TPA: RNA polymerase sigma factor SigJ [Dehalococcoidia bacterium]|nr:RNA polymerase sigma factor SigJ [Dehalococcoidia bacterium]